jgi:hypothetical protein
MNTKKEISAAFPFESKFIEINGSKMHYMVIQLQVTFGEMLYLT